MSLGGNCCVIIGIQFSPVIMTHCSPPHFGGLNSLASIMQKRQMSKPQIVATDQSGLSIPKSHVIMS